MRYHYLQVKHTTDKGDVLGQTLTFESRDEMLTKYHEQAKGAINDKTVGSISILVVDDQLNTVFKETWMREPAETPITE